MKKVKPILIWCQKKVRTFFTWYRNLYRGRKWYTKTLIGIASCIVAFFLYLGAVDINLLWLFGKSPGFSAIKEAVTSEASEIYSDDGVLIGKYFNENRTPVEYEDVNPAFWKALIDTEDERFYKHHGIDYTGLVGAVKDAVLHHDARGASTITQQLAKNMFRMRTNYSTGLLGKLPGVRMLIVKSKEWIIATKLEMTHSKKEILTMYANTVDFGSNAFGIKTAAKTYFNCSPKELTAEQAAVLVGMLKATTYYNPIANPKNSLRRRNIVLSNMVRHGDLTHAEYDSISQIDIELKYSVESNYDGTALYFREAVADELRKWCNDNDYDLYTSGLKIYTTIDSRMQKYAEEAAIKQMKQVQRNFNNHWGNQERTPQRHPGLHRRHCQTTASVQVSACTLPEQPRLYRVLPQPTAQSEALRLRAGHYRARNVHYGLHTLHGSLHALLVRSNGTTDRCRESMGGRHRLQVVEVRQGHCHAPARLYLQALRLHRSYEPGTHAVRQAPRRVLLDESVRQSAEQRGNMGTYQRQRLLHRRLYTS